MTPRFLQHAVLIGLLAALLIMVSGLAAQEATPGGFPLTATALAGGTDSTATITPLPSLTPGAAAATAVPTQAAPTGLPSLTPTTRASLTPLPSLTPEGFMAPPTQATTVPAEVAPTVAATPVGEALPDAEATAEATAEAGGEASQGASGDLAPVRIVVPYVSQAQQAPAAPEGAAGLGTLILLLGLGGATVVGLLMVARERFRDHREE